MKKIVKMGIAVAAISGIGYLAYKGVKKLMDRVELEANRVDECDCANCDCGGCCESSDCCEHSDGCACHNNDKVAEPANEEPVEIVVEEKNVEEATAPVNDETI